MTMSPDNRSFTELPLVVTRGRAPVLNNITMEVCKDCNGKLGREIEQKVEPVFVELAQAAEDGIPHTVSVADAKLLARFAEKMAITNELHGNPPERVATTGMGQAILRGGTVRGAAVWAARHPADYMLSTVLCQPTIAATEIPRPGEYERRAMITAITFHYLTLLVFIPGPGGPFTPPTPLPLAPDLWTLIWPVTRGPEYPPMAVVGARELERTMTDFSRWLLTPRSRRTVKPSPVPPQVIQRN
jgi:hypothetical protein